MFLMMTALLIGSMAFAQERSLLDLLTPQELEQEFGLAPMSLEDVSSVRGAEALSWSDTLNEWPIVVRVNKAARGPSAQQVQVYVQGQLRYTWKTSTGRERSEIAKSGRATFTGTPTGWFAPQWMTPSVWSATWHATMRWTVFFNGGIALHATTTDHYKELGTRASGGCVRLHATNAEILYRLIQQQGKGSVPRFLRDGRVYRDDRGEIVRGPGWNTLIIVVNEP